MRLADESLLVAGLGAVAINAAICYVLATPVPNMGITMPALVPPLAAVLCAYLFAPDAAPRPDSAGHIGHRI